jgi:hypothetical protein
MMCRPETAVAHSGSERWLIDRDGDTWRWGDPRLSQKLNTDLSGTELAHFTTTNMGFVSVEHAGRRLQVRCRPKRVGPLTFASLCYFIVDYPWQPIALTLLADQWATRIYPQSPDVLETLSRLIPGSTPEFFDGPQRPILSTPLDSTPSPLLEKTRAIIPRFTDVPDYELMDQVFAGRWSIGHFEADMNHYVFDHMGTGFRRSILMDTLSDARYAAWVQESRRAAIASAEPVLEAVDAIAETSSGLARLCYHRVMHTFTDSLGRCLVFSAAVDDSSIDLRKTG